MTAQKRAEKGGEVGANGEFYKGGAFIANTDHPKGQPKAAKVRKAEIKPWVWVEQPSSDHRAICAMLSGIDFKYNHTNGQLEASQNNIPQYRLDLANAFNNGQMWCLFNKETKQLEAI